MKASFVLALLAACVAGAAAQGTLAPTPPPGVATPPPPAGGIGFDDLPNGQQDPVVDGRTFSGFIVVNTLTNPAYVGTAESLPNVLTNGGGGPASITSLTPFDVTSFFLANPSESTGVVVTVTCTPTSVSRSFALMPNQGAMEYGPLPFTGCTELVFEATETAGRKLLQTIPLTTTSFTLDNLVITASAAAPPAVPTAAPTAGAPPPDTAAPTASTPPPGTVAPTATPPPGTVAPTATPPPVTAAPTAGSPPPVTAAPTAGSPPPAVARPPPSILPTAVPTARPPPGTPTAAPTAVPAGTPTAAPTVAPTRTPTRGLPATCPVGQYRSQFGCARCVSRSSPFKQFSTVGTVCYPPTTLSRRSTVCTSAVLPAFIQSNVDRRRTVRCINPRKSLVTLLLPIKNSNLPFLNQRSYVGASLRLNGVIPRSGFSNGELVFSGFNRRLRFRFVDSNRTLLRKWGQTVQLTGTLRRGGNLLNYCFVAYLKVC